MSYRRCRYDQPPGHSGGECVSGPSPAPITRR